MAAKKAGIPVILLDRRVDPVAKPGRDYLTFIGSDFVEVGRVARWAGRWCGYRIVEWIGHNPLENCAVYLLFGGNARGPGAGVIAR